VAVLALVALAGAPTTASAADGATAIAWGWNIKEQLGAGYKSSAQTSPVPVVGLTNIKAVAAGYGFSLALLGDGTLRSWGGNAYGQLGNGTRANSGQPAPVGGAGGGLKLVKQASAGGTHALALLESGRVMAWGSNEYGQLGDGRLNPNERVNGRGETEPTMVGTGRTEPVEVPGLSNVVAIASSNFALLSDGTVMAWGKNDRGQLGIGTTGPEVCNTEGGAFGCSTQPRPVVNCGGERLPGVIAVSGGGEAGYALLSDHTVMSWGSNTHGQLGDRTVEHGSNCAGPVESLSKALAISGGGAFALALLENGRVMGWGANGAGEIGGNSSDECTRQPGSCTKTPKEVEGLERVTAISAGRVYSLALSGGTVYAFGDNDPWGQLGIGNTTSTRVPTPLQVGHSSKGGPVAGIAAGEQHSLAFLQSGSAVAPPEFIVTPGAGSLTVLWTVEAQEYHLRWKRASDGAYNNINEEWIRHGCSVAEPCSFVIEDLSEEPYDVSLALRSDGIQTGHKIVEDTTPLATIPDVTGVSPTSGSAGWATTVTIAGAN
jgi:alpha-tubulin suppressor-like RCC1 family protein